MRTLLTLLLSVIILVCTFSTSSCIKDLPRNNPLDTANNAGNAKKEIKFSSYQVVCKYPNGSFTYTEDNSVKAGDSIFLQINMKNTGATKISGIRASISSNSGLVIITPIPGGAYIKFTEGSSATDDFINTGDIGYGEITDGTNFYDAPDYNSYAVCFKVSISASTGNTIPFTIQTTDNTGLQWSEIFYVTVN